MTDCLDPRASALPDPRRFSRAIPAPVVELVTAVAAPAIVFGAVKMLTNTLGAPIVAACFAAAFLLMTPWRTPWWRRLQRRRKENPWHAYFRE